MIKLEFPSHLFKIKNEKDREQIFDECRKQWVALTPEEWVRQNFLQYLIKVKHYPSSLIAVEREIFLEDVRKRFDIVVYKQSVPWMIVECKEMNVSITEAVIRQALNYNITLKVQYIVLTNGVDTFAVNIESSKPVWLSEIPDF